LTLLFDRLTGGSWSQAVPLIRSSHSLADQSNAARTFFGETSVLNAMRHCFQHHPIDGQGGSSLMTVAQMTRSCAQLAVYFDLLQQLARDEVQLAPYILRQLEAAVIGSLLEDLCHHRLIEAVRKPSEFQAAWQSLIRSVRTTGKPSPSALLLRRVLGRSIQAAAVRILSTADFTSQQVMALLPCLKEGLMPEDANFCVDVISPAIVAVIKLLPKLGTRMWMPDAILPVLASLTVNDEGKQAVERCAGDVQTWLLSCIGTWWSSNQVPQINVLLSIPLQPPIDRFVTASLRAFLAPVDGSVLLDRLVASPSFAVVQPVCTAFIGLCCVCYRCGTSDHK